MSKSTCRVLSTTNIGVQSPSLCEFHLDMEYGAKPKELLAKFWLQEENKGVEHADSKAR